MLRFPLYLFGGLLFAVFAYQLFDVPAEAHAIQRTPPEQLLDVLDASAADVEVDELMDFLGVRAWKVRLEAEEPFDCYKPRLVRWERDENDAWVGTQLGRSTTYCVGTSGTSVEVTVFLREEGATARLGLAGSGPGGGGFADDDRASIPVEEARRYTTTMSGAGLVADGHRVLCAEVRGGTLDNSLDCLESFLALEVELHRDGS